MLYVVFQKFLSSKMTACINFELIREKIRVTPQEISSDTNQRIFALFAVG